MLIVTCAVAAVIASLGLAAAADAATRARICARKVSVRNTPSGFTVGYLFRRDRILVSRRSANRRWLRIVTPTELRGWIPASARCR
jgi:hypothetical protein